MMRLRKFTAQFMALAGLSLVAVSALSMSAQEVPVAEAKPAIVIAG